MAENHLSQILTPITPESGTKIWLDISWDDTAIVSIGFTDRENPQATKSLPAKWKQVFDYYWENPSKKSSQRALGNLPLNLEGTQYQKKVWKLLQQIPLGETASYGELSNLINSSPRAVAAACRANPVVLAVPCHRVVAKNGLGGFMGATEGEAVDIKKWLIVHEQ